MSCWWDTYGQFKADGAYPQPGQVVAEYRKRASWSRSTLANHLGVGETAIHYMEKQDRGLDSIVRRRELCALLAIPQVLLGLCSQPSSDSWWISDYELWHIGNDGWPDISEVVKWYRREKNWTQLDLATSLGIEEVTVRAFEKKRSSINSIKRRRALRFLLNIPPVLLGLDALHMVSLPNVIVVRSTAALIPLEKVQLAQKALWDGYYNEHGQNTLQCVGNMLTDIQYALPNIIETSRTEYLEEISLLYQAVGNILLAGGNQAIILPHFNAGIKFARLSNNRNLLSTALGRKAAALLELGEQEAAEKTIREALSVAPSSEVVMRYPVASRVLSMSATDEQDRSEVLKMVDSIIVNDRYRNGVDPNIIGWVKGQVLINLAEYSRNKKSILHQASEVLDRTERNAPDVPRRLLIIKLSQARCAVALREFDYSASLAIEVFELMRKLKSVLYMPQIMEIYRTLLAVYSESPLTARLGLLLFRVAS